MSPQFVRDRKRGEKGQKIVAEIFRGRGFTVHETPRGFHPGFDLSVRGKGMDFKVEVKTDYKSQETGNLCIEVSSLTRSSAGLLAILSGEAVYLTDLQQTLQLAQQYPIRQMGENGWASSALIPLPEFISALKPKVLTTNL
jgi:hypothetical protein